MNFNNFEGSRIEAQGIFAQDAVVSVASVERQKMAQLEDENRRLKYRVDEVNHWYKEVQELARKYEIENIELKKKVEELEEKIDHLERCYNASEETVRNLRKELKELEEWIEHNCECHI